MLGYRPDEFPGRAVFEALGRGQEVSDEHVFAYAALRPAERRDDGWWLTGRPDPGRDAELAEELVERCDGIEVDGLTFSLAHVWRGEAVLRISGGADERVTDTDAFFRAWHPAAAAAAARARGRAHGGGLRGVDARGDAPARGRALQRDHAQVVRPAPAGAELPRAPRRQRRVRGRLGLSARARDRARARAGGRARDRRPGRRPARARRARAGAARRRRHVRLLPPEDDGCGRPHEGSEREARHHRGPRRGARRPADRPRDRLHHRRPRHAGLAGRDPLGRPGAAARRGPGRAGRRRASASASSTSPPGSSASCAVPT